MKPHRPTRFPVLMLGLTAIVSCQSGAAPEPSSRKPAGETDKVVPGQAQPASTTRPQQAPRPTPVPGPVASVAPTPGDPVSGQFTLEDATRGLPATGKLVAELKTDKGTLSCELWPDKAPITVANFVGLARGLRPWKDTGGEWVKKPLYDGTPFHRVVKGFMIQGGDPMGSGAGGPGFVIPDEIWEGARHDERGLLCMANRGKNTNGSQFFILDGAAAHLDGGYTIFGKCGPESVIEKIATVETRGDKAVNPAKINKVVVKRAAQ